MKPDASAEGLVHDIWMFSECVRSVEFVFSPREGNRGVHSGAAFVLKEGGSFKWDCIGPLWMFNTLADDVNLSIRI